MDLRMILSSSRASPTMDAAARRHGLQRLAKCIQPAKQSYHQSTRRLATVNHEVQGGIQAAPAIAFTNNRNQFRMRGSRGSGVRAEMIDEQSGRRPMRRQGGGGAVGGFGGRPDAQSNPLLRRIRIVPASPSYFTATPNYTDDLLRLSALLRKYQLLPQLPPGESPRTAWKTIEQYKTELAEPVRAKGYKMLLDLLKRLNYIHPSLMPEEVTTALEKFMRVVQPSFNKPKPLVLNKDGVARAVGRRKSSSAAVFVVEGEGKVLINNKPITDYFGRLHDRETAVWALKATQRLDKYNVWALARGGGTTGQADAISLGCAKALLVHEPALKPALRRGEFACCFLTNILLTPRQPKSSPETPEELRERSPANSKPARCLPGSSGNVPYSVPYLCKIPLSMAACQQLLAHLTFHVFPPRQANRAFCAKMPVCRPELFATDRMHSPPT